MVDPVVKKDKKTSATLPKSNTKPTKKTAVMPIVVPKDNTEKLEESPSKTKITEPAEVVIEQKTQIIVEDNTTDEDQQTEPEPANNIVPEQPPVIATPATTTPVAKKPKVPGKPPYLHQLPSSIQKEIPEIHIAAHVYYKNKPSSRLASINGKLMREGDTLAKGLKVAEISSDGVIFSYKKYFFYVDVF